MTYPYLLFDAGGVVLFPDQSLIADAARAVDVTLDASRAYDAHFSFAHAFDEHTRHAGTYTPAQGRDYANHLLRYVGAPEDRLDALTESLARLEQKRCLWGSTRPWIRPAIDALREAGYRISIISNSDGHVAEYLEKAGLADCFDIIIDSARVGIDKPDPAIFHLALERLELNPEDAVFFGDIYHVDILGAAGAGVAAVHMDPLGLYGDWPGVHIQDIRAALDWLDAQNWPEDGRAMVEAVRNGIPSLR